MADIEINGIVREKTSLDGTENIEGQDAGGGIGSSFRAKISAAFDFFNTAVGTVGTGRKVGRASPTFAYRDWEGDFRPDPAGGDAPAIVAYDDTRGLAWAVGEKFDTDVHVPHDCVPSTPHYFHPHLQTNGTDTTGGLQLSVAISHRLGDGRTAEVAQASIVKTVTIPMDGLKLGHSIVQDTEFMRAGGGAGFLDSDLLLPDDTITFSCEVLAVPIVTAGSPRVFIPKFDIHAQTTGELGTKNMSINFYT